MKVLIINKSFNKGGAAIASKQLFFALLQEGVSVNMLVFDQLKSDDKNISIITKGFFSNLRWWYKFIIERIFFLPHELNKANRYNFSPAFSGIDITKHPKVVEADIIHLNWINQGFLSIKSLNKLFELGKPIVWTMHDMWPFTGGCHHSWGCQNFSTNCGNCKFLKTQGVHDLSFKQFDNKMNIYSKSNVHFIAVSNWLQQNALKSSLITKSNISVLPNSIDVELYQNIGHSESRKILDFSNENIYVLFGAHRIDDEIKGIFYLIDAISSLRRKGFPIILVLFGGKPKLFPNMIKNSKIPIKYMEHANIKLKQLLYSASDLTCVPSLYETFGLVAAESMACETPVVAFNNSGVTEIIDHLINGYLADYKSRESIALGIEWIILNNRNNKIGKAARTKIVNEFSQEIVAAQHIKLYNSLLIN